MNLKIFLQHKFKYEEQQALDKQHIVALKASILSYTKNKKKILHPKYLFLSVALGIVLVVGVVQIANVLQSKQVHVLPIASAQEVIQKTQAALEKSTKIYYKIHYSGKRYEKKVKEGFQIVEPPQGEYEYWYDFQNNAVRIEKPDPLTQGQTKLVLIQKKINAKQYALYNYTADSETKKGEFHEDVVSNDHIFYRPTGGLENGVNLPTNPQQRFEEILKKFNTNNNVKLETIQANGKEYYKLSVNQPYDKSKEDLQVTEYTLVINKTTFEPYKEISVYEEGKGVIETIYDKVSTDFDSNIFGPVPPKGYSVK